MRCGTRAARVNVARTYGSWRAWSNSTASSSARSRSAKRCSRSRAARLAGLDTAVELRQSEGARPETRQQLESVDEQIGLPAMRWAALVAETPQASTACAGPVRRCIRWPADVVPADLIGRRADLVAARWRVESAVATSPPNGAVHPNINLKRLRRHLEHRLGPLLAAAASSTASAPAIRLPIFDSGACARA